ncbi:outer membrane efflux protein [mine drainage metagenome]|uniref:Outer membrane efflux protein n=1 Tax=mine drainage metagenome TaxID=410659 RepID=A0A1J5QVY6_9ZZZZ
MSMKLAWIFPLMIPLWVMAGEVDTLTPDPALTLRDVLQQAVDRNPQRHVLQAMDGEVQARYTYARGMLPNSPAISVRHVTDTIGSGRGEREWEAELELPVWLPGQRTARQAVANGSQADLAASREGLMLQVAGVLRDVIWDIDMNANSVELIRHRLSVAEALQHDVERRYKAGELAKTDFMLTQNETLQAQAALLRAEAELKHAQHRYTVLTGLKEIPARVDERQSEKTGLSEQHPLLREADTKTALAQSERDLVHLEKRENPQLMLAARSLRGAYDPQANDSIGLKLRIPFDTEVRSAPLMAAAENNVAKYVTERERLFNEMETALHEAEHNLEVTRAELEVSTQQNEIAQENLRLAKKAFGLGETDLVRLLLVQSQAYEAERAFLSRKIQLHWDIARYNQAVGVLP